jgi:DNA modification methylase
MYDNKDVKYKVVEKLEYGKWVTNEGNEKLPVYRWFPYKESFSKQLVDMILDANPKAKNVLDPFAGVGTTLLACKERNTNCVGIEASNMCVKITMIKLMDYDIEMLKKDVVEIKKRLRRKNKSCELSWHHDELLKKSFSKSTLSKIIRIRGELHNLNYKNFFLLALANASAKVAFLRKDGAYLKPRKPKYKDVVKAFFHETDRMIRDVASFGKLNNTTYQHVINGDARNIPLKDGGFDLIITSPPYLEKEEYKNIYFIERFVLLDKTHEKERKYFGYAKKRSTENMIKSYFRDMELLAKEMYCVLKNKGKAYVVISDACVEGTVVECCIKSAEIFEDASFKINKIYIVKRRWCTKKRVIKTGRTNESIVVVEKKDI